MPGIVAARLILDEQLDTYSPCLVEDDSALG